jgi:hypothetical protein
MEVSAIKVPVLAADRAAVAVDAVGAKVSVLMQLVHPMRLFTST